MENEKSIILMNEELNVLKTEEESIRNLIYTIRGKQVMLDSDVARLYHYETKYINLAVRRNKERFPKEFCFQLNESDLENLRLQFATLNKKINNGNVTRKYLPYVFTEQGIAMLSGMLRNEVAVQVSINIMNAFVEMRKFLNQNRQVFERLSILECKQFENEKNFKQLFDMFKQEEEVTQKIFFQGQIWDSYSLIIDIIKKASNKIVIIDNYIDDSILKMLAKKKNNVESIIITSEKSNISQLDIQKFNKEYPILKVAKTKKFHDRFIVIDNKELYHCGASIKDLGKKCFAINKIEDERIISQLINQYNSFYLFGNYKS